METLLAVSSLPLFILTVVTSSIPTAAVATSNRVAIRLIHRDSIDSPYHSPKENETGRMERIMKVSMAHLQRTLAMDDDIQADLLPSPSNFMFIVNLSIGRPPISQFTIMDTGSSLLWVPCLPCKHCSEHDFPIYDPTKSSTFAPLTCNSEYCSQETCNSFNQCEYSQGYVRGAHSSGILATEQLTFETTDEGIVTMPNVVFGCSHDNGNFIDHRISGVLGLDYGKISLVRHFSSSFSYCIGSVFDPNYRHNKLFLGSGAKMDGDTTPLEVINGSYYIDMQGISIGEKRLDIDPTIFQSKSNGTSGVIIDSGTPATWLVKGAYETLEDEVRALLDGWLSRVFSEPYQLCYQGILSQDLIGFPVVTFHFAQGAELDLDIESLFFQNRPDVFCMAVFLNDNIGISTDLSSIGMMSQQNYNVAYDIQGKKLYFQRIDCQLLGD